MKNRITLNYNLKSPLVDSNSNLFTADFWRFLVNLERQTNNSARMQLEALTISDITFNADWNTDLIMCDTSLNPVTINLPAASIVKYKPIIIKCLNIANNVALLPNGSETLDNTTSIILTAYESLQIISDGYNLWSI